MVVREIVRVGGATVSVITVDDDFFLCFDRYFVDFVFCFAKK